MHPAPTTSRSAPQLRVLVVDDNVDGAEALCALLDAMGCITAVAFDGAQGLAAASRFDPHLALVDLELPDMSGCDVARQFRAKQQASSARLICLTGRSREADRSLCGDAGFDEFVTKPVQPGWLDAVVASANSEINNWGGSLAGSADGGTHG